MGQVWPQQVRVTELNNGAEGNVRGQRGTEPGLTASLHEGGPAKAKNALHLDGRGLRGRMLRRVAEHPRRGHSLEFCPTDV